MDEHEWEALRDELKKYIRVAKPKGRSPMSAFYEAEAEKARRLNGEEPQQLFEGEGEGGGRVVQHRSSGFKIKGKKEIMIEDDRFGDLERAVAELAARIERLEEKQMQF